MSDGSGRIREVGDVVERSEMRPEDRSSSSFLK